MVVTFKTRRPDRSFGLLILILALFIIGYLFFCYSRGKVESLFYGGSIPAAMFLWQTFSLFFLKISIEGNFLKVWFLFTLYKVDIRDINYIQRGETMWAGFHKYGTATKGLVVSSKFKSDLYITPQNEELFLEKLISINPEIKIKQPVVNRGTA